MKSVTTFALLLAYCHCVTFPQSFKKCSRRQPDFNQCFKDAAEYNIHQLVHPYPDLHLPGLNPLLIPSLLIGSGRRAVSVEQRFSDCSIYGLHQVLFEKFEFEFGKKILVVDAHFAEITKKCTYEVNGRVLLLPIVGHGSSRVVIRDMRLWGYFHYQEVRRDGKTYITLDSRHLEMEVSHMSFHFDNLFNGDRGLGDNVNQVLNDNWKEVFEDVRPNYSEAISEIVQSLCNQFFGRVSMEDMFGPA